MGRRSVYLHLGLAGSGGGFLETALPEHAAALAAQGVAHPVVATDEMFRAGVEIRRDHRSWGFARRDVEGTWAAICRRVHKSRSTVLLSQELLAGCTADQADLLLDTLAGTEVHAVLTARRPDVERHEFSELTDRWRRALGRRNHLHTLVVPPYAEPLGWIWSELGGLVGFDAVGFAPRAQCGCQASSSAVREVTASGSLPSASSWIETRSNTSRSERRAAIHTCCSTSADSL